MENHPIPQDVTGFQFKLIGNMTVKQFAFLAAGAVLAVIAYYTPVTALWAVVVKYTLVPVFGLTGAAFAFLPYEGRPLDVMVSHFVMALFKPNQYIYHKLGGRLAFLHFSTQPVVAQAPIMVNGVPTLPVQVPHDPTHEAKLQALLSSLHTTGVDPIPLDEKEKYYMQDLFDKSPVAAPTAIPVARPQPTPQPEPVTSQPIPTPVATPASPKPSSWQDLGLQAKRDSGVVPQSGTPQNDEQKTAPAPTQSAPATPPVTANAAKELGLPHLPDSPNLLIGIIKDSRGNVLAGILVEVKDKDGNPVRAFKTNQLGQFASATPLPNGSYTIEFEDPKAEQKFRAVSLTADGTILQPLIIVSIDAREELRKELFG